MAGAVEASQGRYQTLRRLAVGGMGEIFLARERGRLGFSRLVVLKRMLPQLARDRDIVEMFVDEARIVGNLSHPNICQILELGDDNGVPFLALEYVRGASVSEIWDRAQVNRESIPLAVTLRILAETARALHFAHEASDAEGRALNVIHRDISPHNVMVSFEGDVKLMDFGIARADNRLHRTDTGKIKGKVSYMAPEQLRGQELDRRADVFAVGVMLWELTLQRRLFGGAGEVETLRKAVACEVPDPRTIEPAYPAALATIVLRALAADRDHRTATAGELASALFAQSAQIGAAERIDVARTLQQLFPGESAGGEEAADSAPTMVDAALPFASTSPVAPSASQPEGRPTVPLRVEHPHAATGLRPTVRPHAESSSVSSEHRLTAPLRVESPSASTELRPTTPLRVESPARETTEPVIGRARRGRTVAIAALVTAVAIAGVLVVISRRGDDAAVAALPPPIVTARITPPPPPEVIRPTPPGTGSAAPAKVIPAQPPPAEVHETLPALSSRVAHHSAPPRRTDVTAPVIARPPSVPSAIAPIADTPGRLAVSSERMGVVLIDGQRRKSTPFQTELTGGDHEVAVELSEGAGTLRTKIHVEAGRKTKCKAEGGVLSCALAP